MRALGAHIKEIPGNRGTSWEVTIGGGRKWRLDPKVNLLGSKPDFVLTCDDTSVPRMAIFCDGWRYHASDMHNRLDGYAFDRGRFMVATRSMDSARPPAAAASAHDGPHRRLRRAHAHRTPPRSCVWKRRG